MHVLKYLTILAVIGLVPSGCTTVRLTNGAASHFYVGAVRVIFPRVKGKVQAVDVEGLGFGWDKGPFLGWRSNKWVIADPKDCQLIVIIRSPSQSDNAAQVLDSLKGQKLCLVDTTRRLSDFSPSP